MDIRKYLVKLNSNGDLVPLVYDKDEDSRNRSKLKHSGSKSKGLTCNGNRKKQARTKKQLVLDSETQYALDLGQRDFDAIECKICKMLYTKGELKDEKHHSVYHNDFLSVNSLKFPSWKVERVVVLFNDGDKIISIYPNDPKHMINKAEELVKIADEELGISSPFEQLLKHICFFLIYVTSNRRIGGFTAGEKVSGSVAFLLCIDDLALSLTNSLPSKIRQAAPLTSNHPLTIATTKQSAEVGIARLWVHESFRRQKFATRLVDILRANLYRDRIVGKDKIAFSESTSCGIEFARCYTNQNLLIYSSPT